MLTIAELSVAYGAIRALSEVTVRVPKGQVVAVVGANGAGKSTLLKTVAGQLRPTRGAVVWNDSPLPPEPHRVVQQGISLVPEGRQVFPHLTVRENLILGGYLRTRAEVAESLEQAFALFPRLRERTSQLAGTLSGGEQQMLAIGRGLMARPQVLLLDEPSLGLAPLIVKEIFRTIRSINAAGTTVVLVEQNAKQALAACHYGYVLGSGKVVAEGTGPSLLGRMDLLDAYLGGAKHTQNM